MHLLWGEDRRSGTVDPPDSKSLACRWREALLALIILGLALFLRLYRLDLAQFKGDDAMVISLANGIAQGAHFPLIGIPSSIGLPNPPLFPYLIALPLLVQRDVLAPIVFVVMLNVAAVGLTYAFVRRYFGQGAAVVASLLYAVGFWPVFFSRFIWAQNVLPAFSALTGLCLFEATLKGKRWFFVLACIFAGLMAQGHFSALVYLPLLAVSALLFWRRLGRSIGFGAVALALTFGPYLYHDLQSGATAVQRMAELVSQSGSLHGWIWIYPAELLGHLGYQAWLGDVEGQVAGRSVDVRWASWIEASLLAIGFAYIGVRALVRHREVEDGGRYGLLALWVLVPVLIFSRSSYHVYEHYFIALYPALFAIVGVAVGDGVRWLVRRMGAAKGAGLWMVVAPAGIVLAAVAGAQLYFNMVSISYFAQGHGPPVLLGQMREALTEAGRAREATNASQIWIVAPGEPSQVGSLGHLFDSLGKLELGAQTLGGADTLVWRASSLPQVYLSARGGGPADLFLRSMPSALPLSTIEDIRREPFMDIFALAPRELEEAAQRAFTPVNRSSTVGVRLLGCAFEPEATIGKTILVALWWKVEDTTLLSPTSDERFFMHIAPAPHEPQVAQEDGIGYANWRWAVGDSVISWFSVPIPSTVTAGDYLIRVGLYDLTSMKRASFLNEQGQSAGDSLLFGPVHLLWGED